MIDNNNLKVKHDAFKDYLDFVKKTEKEAAEVATKDDDLFTQIGKLMDKAEKASDIKKSTLKKLDNHKHKRNRLSQVPTDTPVIYRGVDITEGVELEKEKIEAINALIRETEKIYQENDEKVRNWFTNKPPASIPKIVQPKVAISFTLFALTITITWNLLTPLIPKPEPTPIYFMEEDREYDVVWPIVDRHDFTNEQEDTFELKSLRKITFEDAGRVFNVSEYTYKEQMKNDLVDKEYEVNRLNENNIDPSYELQKNEYSEIYPPDGHFEIKTLLDNSTQNSKISEIKKTLENFKYYVHNVDVESKWIYYPDSPKENAIYFASNASAKAWGEEPYLHVAQAIGVSEELLLINLISEKNEWGFWYPIEGVKQNLGKLVNEEILNTYVFDGDYNNFIKKVANNTDYSESYLKELDNLYIDNCDAINSSEISYELFDKIRSKDTNVLNWLKGKVVELKRESKKEPSINTSSPEDNTSIEVEEIQR